MSKTHQEYLDRALQQLRSARLALSTEISAYPAPISGCDAQFNYLLSERQKIAEAIAALNTQPFIPTPRSLNQNTAIESR